MTFGFRISIDGHDLHVIATDGNDVIARTVQSAILFPGERMDFWVDANDPGQLGKYWIRAENMEYYLNHQVKMFTKSTIT